MATNRDPAADYGRVSGGSRPIDPDGAGNNAIVEVRQIVECDRLVTKNNGN